MERNDVFAGETGPARCHCIVRSTADALACPAKVGALARAAGFDERNSVELEIAASELATNIVRHGVAGTITAQFVDLPAPGIMLTAHDEGPGFDDVERASRDGISQGVALADSVSPSMREGLGSGLGALQRLMDFVEIGNAEEGGGFVIAYKAVRQ
jgi:serine/threonine-protein kinase RsbT